jgi:hypothetical protein
MLSTDNWRHSRLADIRSRVFAIRNPKKATGSDQKRPETTQGERRTPRPSRSLEFLSQFVLSRHRHVGKGQAAHLVFVRAHQKGSEQGRNKVFVQLVSSASFH